MGVSFVAPVFLAGLVAIAVPVLVHLTHRERKEAVRFPSLMFVRRIPFRTSRRQRIRHWPLFLLRCAALVLLAAAFARPLLDRATGTAAAFASARELVVLLDRSHSMAYGDRWNRARTAARRALEGLGPDDRATLVLFDERAEAATPRTADAGVLSGALDGAEPGYERTRFGPALQLARELVERSDRPRAEVFLISDFQRSGWDARRAVRLPEGAGLTYVDVSEPDARNLAVVDAALASSRSGGRDLLIVSARLMGAGEGGTAELELALEVDGQELERAAARVGADGATTVQFEPVVRAGRQARGVVRGGADRLPGDDAFRFVIDPTGALSVLVVDPRSARRDHSLYLRRALGIGSRPGFEVSLKRVTRLQVEDLSGQSVIVLNDAPFPGGPVGRRLQEFVTGGGGLLVILGRHSPPSAWPSESLPFLPAGFGSPVDRSGGGGTLSYLDWDHPAMQLFRVPRSGDFSAARFFRYRRLEPEEGARVLARFDDGAAALVEGRRGDGVVLVWGSGLQNFWNDLTLQPVFLPFAHQVIRHLSGYSEPRPSYRVGEAVDLFQDIGLGADVVAAAPELLLERPDGGREVVRLAESRYLSLTQPGFYEIRGTGTLERFRHTLAVNLDPLESDLARVDPEELASAIAQRGGLRAAEAAVELRAEERERRQGLWWYLLLAAAATLVLETVLSNRIRRAAVAAPTS